MPAGSLVGALIVSYLGDFLGRKKTIMLSGLIWVLGAIFLFTASLLELNWCSLQAASFSVLHKYVTEMREFSAYAFLTHSNRIVVC